MDERATAEYCFDTVLEIFLELFEIIFFPKNAVILTYIKVQFV